MGATHFRLRTPEKVSAEMSLHVLAYNLKRMIAILGVQPLLQAMRIAFSHSLRPRSCENMISAAGVARQLWLAPAGARGQVAIACISGLSPKRLIIRFIL